MWQEDADDDDWTFEDYVAQKLWRINERLERIMADQAALDAALSDLTTHVSTIATGVKDILDKLAAASVPVDLSAEMTAVQAASDSLQASSDAIAAAVAPPVPPAPSEPPLTG